MTTYTVKDLQERYGVGQHTIYGWIKAGELQALSIARKVDSRPKYVFTAEALDAFEQLRTVRPEPTKPQRRSKTKRDLSDFGI